MVSSVHFPMMVLRSFVSPYVLVMAMIYVMRYAVKIKKNPTKSIMYGVEQKIDQLDEKAMDTFVAFTTRHAFVLLSLLIGIMINIYGGFS